MISPENYNRAFPDYPLAFEDKGWYHAVWYCGGFKAVKLHGQYPAGFLERALALFPKAKDILHCPSGTVTGPGVTVDLVRDEARRPQFVASADALPFAEDSFDLVLSDPPYTRKDSRKYGCPPFPMDGFLREARRVLRPGGYLGMLHTYYPQYRRSEWELRGLVAVATGFKRALRAFSIFQPRKGAVPASEICALCGEFRKLPKRWRFGQGSEVPFREERRVCAPCWRDLDGLGRGRKPTGEWFSRIVDAIGEVVMKGFGDPDGPDCIQALSKHAGGVVLPNTMVSKDPVYRAIGERKLARG